MTSRKARLLSFLLGLFITLILLGGCNSTEQEAVFLNVKVDSTWTRYDRVLVELADSSGHTLDTLFHDKLQSPRQLRRLDGSGYEGGSIQVILVGYLGGWVAKHETRRFDGRTGLSDKETRVLIPPPTGEYLHLTDFPWGNDIVHGHIPWIKDSGPFNRLSIGGGGYDRGLSVYSADSSASEAYVTYNLKSMGLPISSFYAEVGVDDVAGNKTCGSVIFKVYLDNVLAYTSPVQTVGFPPLSITVTVSNATILKLALNNAGDGICGDFGVWGNTRLYVAPSTNAL